jgi:hypothetical protein
LQGKAVWIYAFFSFLSGLGAIHALLMSVNLGLEGTFLLPIIGSLIGSIPVYFYLVLSIVVVFLFLGATFVTLVTELSNKALLNEINAKVDAIENGQKLQNKVLESLQARVFLVDESLNSMRKEVAKAFTKQGEDLKQTQKNLSKKFDDELVAIRGELAEQIDGQSEEIKKIGAKLAEVKDDLSLQLVRIDGALGSQERRNKKTEKSILKQEEELEEIKTKMEQLEDRFVSQKPLLTSQCKVEDVRGIGENTGNELREIGITDVGALVLTDPGLIAEKIDMSEKTVEKLQGRAQLGMVPGIKEKDLVLLEEAGVMNRKELAAQDSLELGMKISEISKLHIEEGKIEDAEKPTIEEIYAWIKAAKV